MKLMDVISTANPKKETMLEKGLTASDWINYYSPDPCCGLLFLPRYSLSFRGEDLDRGKRYHSVNRKQPRPKDRSFILP